MFGAGSNDGGCHLVRSQHPGRAFARAAQEAGGGRGGRIFDWAIGWPARGDKIVINARRRNFGIRLKYPSPTNSKQNPLPRPKDVKSTETCQPPSPCPAAV